MDIAIAFLKATAFAYVSCAIFTLLGKPVMARSKKMQQFFYYVFASAIIYYVTINPEVKVLNFFLGTLYSLTTIST